MKALVFRYSLPRLAASRLLGALSPSAYFGPWAPFRLEHIPDPTLPADDWLVVRTARCGICGSDTNLWRRLIVETSGAMKRVREVER